MSKLTQQDFAFRNELLVAMCTRMETMGYSKKKKEEQALEYFCGVCQTLETLKHPLKDNFLMIATFLFQTRGAYSEAKRMIEEYEAGKFAETETA